MNCLFLLKIEGMKKLSKLISATRLIIHQPSLLNLIINENEVWKKTVDKKYSLGAGLPVIDLETLFPEFRVEIPVFSFLDGGSLPTDIALLMNLAKTFNRCSYFEIGTWRGESVVNVAENADTCFTLNLTDEEMRSIGKSEAYIAQTGMFSKNKDNIIHLRGNSRHFDFAGIKQKFDLIFIDGDHHYDSVKNDTQQVFKHLVHDQSIVVWHDYARNPETVRFEVFAGILDGLPEFRHQYLYHVGNTLSAVFLNNKVLPTNPLKETNPPDHYFTLEITLKKMQSFITKQR